MYSTVSLHTTLTHYTLLLHSTYANYHFTKLLHTTLTHYLSTLLLHTTLTHCPYPLSLHTSFTHYPYTPLLYTTLTHYFHTLPSHTTSTHFLYSPVPLNTTPAQACEWLADALLMTLFSVALFTSCNRTAVDVESFSLPPANFCLDGVKNITYKLYNVSEREIFC